MTDPVMQNSSSDVRPTSSRSLILYTVVALGLALFIRFFIAAPYIVSGASMEPTFDNFHYLIIDRVSYGLSEPERGDVIVFDLPENTNRALIKRVIGLPGETLRLIGNTVTIVNDAYPEGFVLPQPYLAAENLGGFTGTTMELGEDQYF